MSLPAWAAWIEILSMLQKMKWRNCRCPHGQRGLKSSLNYLFSTGTAVAARMGSVD